MALLQKTNPGIDLHKTIRANLRKRKLCSSCSVYSKFFEKLDLITREEAEKLANADGPLASCLQDLTDVESEVICALSRAPRMHAFAHTLSSSDLSALDQKIASILATFTGSSLSDASHGLLSQLRVFLPIIVLSCLKFSNVSNFLQKLRGCIQNTPEEQMRSFQKVLPDLENSTVTLAQILNEETSISHNAMVRQTSQKILDGKWLFQLVVSAAGVVHSIVDDNQTCFSRRGVPFMGHTLTEFIQQATIVLAEGAESAAGAEPLLLRLFKLSEATAAVASVLSQWGHHQFFRSVFKWAINGSNLNTSTPDQLRDALDLWRTSYKSEADLHPLLLLVPLPLIPQLMSAPKKPPLPDELYTDPPEAKLLTLGALGRALKFQHDVTPLDGAVNGRIQLIRCTPEHAGGMFYDAMQSHLRQANRLPFQFEWFFSMANTNLPSVEQWCQTIRKFPGGRYVIFGAQLLSLQVRNALVLELTRMVSAEQTTPSVRIYCEGDGLAFQPLSQDVVQLTAPDHCDEALSQKLQRLLETRGKTVFVAGHAGSGKSHTIQTKWEGAVMLSLHNEFHAQDVVRAAQRIAPDCTTVWLNVSSYCLDSTPGNGGASRLYLTNVALCQLMLFRFAHAADGGCARISPNVRFVVEAPPPVEGADVIRHLFTSLGLFPHFGSITALDSEGLLNRLVVSPQAKSVAVYLSMKPADLCQFFQRAAKDQHRAELDHVDTSKAMANYPMSDDKARSVLARHIDKALQSNFYTISIWLSLAKHYFSFADGPQVFFKIWASSHADPIVNELFPALVKQINWFAHPHNVISSQAVADMGGVLLPDFGGIAVPYAGKTFKSLPFLTDHSEKNLAQKQQGVQRQLAKENSPMVVTPWHCIVSQIFTEGWSDTIDVMKAQLSMHFIVQQDTIVRMLLINERMKAGQPLIISSATGVGKTYLLEFVEKIVAVTASRKLRDRLTSRQGLVTELKGRTAEQLKEVFPALAMCPSFPDLMCAAWDLTPPPSYKGTGHPVTDCCSEMLQKLASANPAMLYDDAQEHLNALLDERRADHDQQKEALRAFCLALENPVLRNPTFRVMIHPGFTERDLEAFMAPVRRSAELLLEAPELAQLKVLVFFDELNTSSQAPDCRSMVLGAQSAGQHLLCGRN